MSLTSSASISKLSSFHFGKFNHLGTKDIPNHIFQIFFSVSVKKKKSLYFSRVDDVKRVDVSEVNLHRDTTVLKINMCIFVSHLDFSFVFTIKYIS